MTHHHPDDDTTGHDANRADTLAPSNGASHRHGGHGLMMMIACCIPMLLIAVVLVVTGVASVGFLFLALACTVMMALMMWGMPGGGHGEPARQEHPGALG